MFYSGFVVQRSRNFDGAYNICQVENSELCDYKGKSRVPFHSTVAIFAVSGSIHTETFEMEVTLEVYKMNLGIFHGYPNRAIPNQAFKINLDLSMVEGSVELRLTEFDELWLDINTKIFQVAENGPGKFIGYRTAHFIRELPPGIQCAPWGCTETQH